MRQALNKFFCFIIKELFVRLFVVLFLFVKPKLFQLRQILVLALQPFDLSDYGEGSLTKSLIMGIVPI